MFNNSPKIALVGCGAIAESYYLPALQKSPTIVEHLYLVDSSKPRLKEFAAKFEISNYATDYREVINLVDGVIVAVPTHLHHPISLDFLSQGVHVLCEKPLAESIDKANEMVELARKTGVVLSANYLQRLIPSFLEVKRLLARGFLGKPLSLKYYVGEEFDWPTVSGFYFKSQKSSRGVLRDRGAHVLDHICWWLEGKPKLISSQNDSFGGSEAVAHIEFERNECQGEVKLSWLSSFPCKYKIECEAGAIEGDVYDYQSVVVSSKSGKKERVTFTSTNKSDIGFRVVNNFIDVIKTGEKPLVSGSDVLDSIQFVDECYKAAIRFDMPWYKVQEVGSGS